MNESQVLLLSLALFDAAIYGLLAYGLIRARRVLRLKTMDIDDAFRILERSLRARYPDLPEGFTWKEIVSRFESEGIETDWNGIQNTLKVYESYKYGGVKPGNVNPNAVVKLAMSLPRGVRFDTGS